jgi:hypothetical protein
MDATTLSPMKRYHVGRARSLGNNYTDVRPQSSDKTPFISIWNSINSMVEPW